MRGAEARNLARDADLFVVRIADYGVVRVRAGVLEVGPQASPDAIATVACRRLLELDGVRDECAVKAFVETLGAAYVPPRDLRICTSTSGVAYRAVS